MNPFEKLCLNHFSEDVTENFVKTLDSIIYFSEQTENSNINNYFKYTLLCSMDDFDNFEEKYKNINFIEKNPNKNLFHFELSINIFDFLLIKLIENLKRLYSAHNTKGRLTGRQQQHQSISNLNEQQKSIYDCFDLIKNKISLIDDYSIFKHSFFGQTKICKRSEIFLFVGFHQYLLESHQIKHQEFFNQFFNLSNIDWNFLLPELSKISFQEQQSSLIKKQINSLDNKIFDSVDESESFNLIKVSSFTSELFLNFAEKNHPITPNIKFILFNRALQHKHIETLVNENTIPIIKNYLSDIESEKINSLCVDKVLGQIKNNNLISLFISLITRIENPFIFLQLIKSTNLNSNQYKLLSKYDLTESFICNIISQLKSTGQVSKYLNNIFTLLDDKITPNIICNILATDQNLISEIQPIILKLKLNKELNPDKNNSLKNKLKKI